MWNIIGWIILMNVEIDCHCLIGIMNFKNIFANHSGKKYLSFVTRLEISKLTKICTNSLWIEILYSHIHMFSFIFTLWVWKMHKNNKKLYITMAYNISFIYVPLLISGPLVQRQHKHTKHFMYTYQQMMFTLFTIDVVSSRKECLYV